MTNLKTKFRKDGSLTYWSVHEQRWLSAWSVPDRELAAMGCKERGRVQRFAKKHGTGAEVQS